MKAGRADSVPHSPSSLCFPLGTTERPPAAAPLCAPPLPWWWVNPAAMPGQRIGRRYRTAIEHHSDSVYHWTTQVYSHTVHSSSIGTALLEHHIYEHTAYTVHTPMHSPPLLSPIHTKPYSPHTWALECYSTSITLCVHTLDINLHSHIVPTSSMACVSCLFCSASARNSCNGSLRLWAWISAHRHTYRGQH